MFANQIAFQVIDGKPNLALANREPISEFAGSSLKRFIREYMQGRKPDGSVWVQHNRQVFYWYN